MATATWFVRAEGKVRGPFEAIHLHRLVQRGLLGWHHELSEDRRQWVKAQDHPMFEGLAPKPEPPVMSPVPIALPVYSGPPPLPLCAPPAFAPAAHAPPDNTPAPPPPPAAARTGTDWVEQGKDVAERLMKKVLRKAGGQPQEAASLELPELGETPTVYSLDLEDTSVDINVSDAAEAARGWFDDFDLGSWTETFS